MENQAANFFILSTPVGIFEALTNGLWPSEDLLEQAETERLARNEKVNTQ